MKKILITGGFGFLGTHLTEHLVMEKDNLVHVVDDLSNNPVNIDYFINEIEDPKNLSFNIMKVKEYFSSPDLPVFDEIYHLSSPVGPAGVLKHAGNIVRQVVNDCYLIIDYCLAKEAKMLLVSTSEIYGGGQEGYCSENTTKIVPSKTTVRLEYAIGKLAAETAIINTCSDKDLKAVIIRPFNIAGPRQSPKGGFVLPRFIQQAHQGYPLTVFGDGSAIRAFTHVKDMVEGIVLAMHRGRNGEAYNVGNPSNKTNIQQLAEKTVGIVGSKSEIQFVDPKTIYGDYYEEANDKFPDSEKAKKELQWLPRLGIENVIQDSYAEFLKRVEAGVVGKEHSVVN